MVERYSKNKNRSIRWRLRRSLALACFNIRWLVKLRGKRAVIGFGDSHIAIFNSIIERCLLTDFQFDVLFVPGATAQGMMNPRSQTNALKVFEERLQKARPWQTLIIQLGEVDCGFVIWYRAAKYGVTVEEQFSESLASYIAFLQNIKARGWTEIYVLSVPLPTIGDGQSWGEVANARSEVQTPQLDRTRLTLRYNEELQRLCGENGFQFVDVTSEQLDISTGLIKPRFLSRDPLDHHLEKEPYGDYVARQLASVLSSHLFP